MPASLDPNLSATERVKLERDFAGFLRAILIAVALILALPTVIGFFGAPAGTTYLGEPYNTDDHMVYAAWMHQAQRGHLMMDNRFAVDSQPGLTVNLYFFAVGQLSRLVGIPIASNLARITFGVLFAYLLYGFVRRFSTGLFACKLVVSLCLVGAGLGFLVWHDFGRALILDRSLWMKPMTLGSLPTDVWQPEGFVLPSLLTNGLFAVSLCLIVLTFGSILDAQESEKGWTPVVVGALALGLLMNIHSYDVLLVGLVSLGLLVTALAGRNVSWLWVAKVLVITLGVVPGALWFLHVLKNDPVFAARAATPTYAANFRAEVFGYLPLIVLGAWGIVRRKAPATNPWNRPLGYALYSIVFVVLMLSASESEGFAVSGGVWFSLLGVTLWSLYLMADEDPVYNLVLAWAAIGLMAPYFPGLFQRKLAMGLEIPWAMLSAFALSDRLLANHRGTRNLFTALILVILGATSIRWILREVQLIQMNVSETTVQAVYLKPNTQNIVSYLEQRSYHRCVVLCIPGGPSPAADASGNPLPDQFLSPDFPDINPILSGLAGVYTYAGHWSETPDYNKRRSYLLRNLFSANATPEMQREVIAKTDANYVVAPVLTSAAVQQPFADLSTLGKVVVTGPTFQLIEIKAPL
jgi:arabinosyltransferase C